MPNTEHTLCACKAEWTLAQSPLGTQRGECEQCVPEKFKNTVGDHICEQCDDTSNLKTNTEHTLCACKAGWTLAQGQCEQCAPGQFKDTIGDHACSTCTNNSYSALASKSVGNCAYNTGYFGLDCGDSCLQCAAGTYKTSPGEAACEQCTINSDLPPASLQCACNAGSASTNWHAMPCALCTAGKYAIGSGNTQCTNCVLNTYSTAINSITADVCQVCPSDSVSLQGSSLFSHCLCVAPRMMHADGTCKPCQNLSYLSGLAVENDVMQRALSIALTQA